MIAAASPKHFSLCLVDSSLDQIGGVLLQMRGKLCFMRPRVLNISNSMRPWARKSSSMDEMIQKLQRKLIFSLMQFFSTSKREYTGQFATMNLIDTFKASLHLSHTLR